MSDLTLLIPSFALFGFVGVWLTQSLWSTVGVQALIWLVVLCVPFFDGTVETYEQVVALTLPLVVGGLVAAFVGRVRRLAPVLFFDFWRIQVVSGADVSWSVDYSAGLFVLATVFVVLAVGLSRGYIGTTLTSDGGVLAATLVLGAVALTAAVVGLVVALRSTNGRMTLGYTALLLLWAVIPPLMFWLPSPWSLVLVLVFALVVGLLLTVCCTRWHTSRRAEEAATTSDFRLSLSETRFPRHMARWLLLALYSALVYTVAFALIDETFGSVLLAVTVAQLAFALLLLCWSALCDRSVCARGRAKVPPEAAVLAVESGARASTPGGMVDVSRFEALIPPQAAAVQQQPPLVASGDALEPFRLNPNVVGGRRRK